MNVENKKWFVATKRWRTRKMRNTMCLATSAFHTVTSVELTLPTQTNNVSNIHTDRSFFWNQSNYSNEKLRQSKKENRLCGFFWDGKLRFVSCQRAIVKKECTAKFRVVRRSGMLLWCLILYVVETLGLQREAFFGGRYCTRRNNGGQRCRFRTHSPCVQMRKWVRGQLIA